MTANTDPTLASRYIADQLSEPERLEYEAQLLSSPEAVAELEATARVKVGLEKLRDTGVLADLMRQRSRPFPAFTLPLAAGIIAIAVSAWLWWPNPSGTGTNPLLFTSPTALAQRAGHPLPIAVTVALFNRRGAIPTAAAEKPASAGAVALRVLPTTSDRTHRYRLSLYQLQGADFQEVSEISDLVPAEDGFIEVYADAARLTPGHYEVVVTDPAAAESIGSDTLKFDWVARKKP
jgi:hypothetical protein